MLFKISGQKLKQLRGERSLSAIADESGRAFSDVSLMKWENEVMQPKEPNIKALLKVFDCKLEDIAEPLELAR